MLCGTEKRKQAHKQQNIMSKLFIDNFFSRLLFLLILFLSTFQNLYTSRDDYRAIHWRDNDQKCFNIVLKANFIVEIRVAAKPWYSYSMTMMTKSMWCLSLTTIICSEPNDNRQTRTRTGQTSEQTVQKVRCGGCGIVWKVKPKRSHIFVYLQIFLKYANSKQKLCVKLIWHGN